MYCLKFVDYKYCSFASLKMVKLIRRRRVKMIKILAKSIRENKVVSILTPIAITVEVMMECLMVFTMKDLVNTMQTLTPGAAFNMDIVYYAIALLLMATISLCGGALSAVWGAKASCGFAKNLRHDIFNKIQGFSFENIDKFQTSSLVTRLTTDVSNVQMAYQMLLRISVRAPLMIIFSTIMAFTINSELAWLFVIIIPFLGGGLAALIFTILPVFKKLFVRYDKLNNSIQENVKGIRTVKAFVREKYEKQKFDQASDNLANDFTKAEKILALNNPLMQFCIQVTVLLICLLGSKMIVTRTSIFSNHGIGEFNFGDLSSLMTYGIQILSSLMMLSMVLVMLSMAVEGGRRIVEVLKTESKLHDPENPIFELEDGSIKFENVSFKYHADASAFALSNVNLEIKSGQTIGILGSTGSSKTTLINLISRLYDATEGKVIVGGHDVKEYDVEALRKEVSVVLQKNILFSGTIRDNLKWGNESATDEEIIRVAKIAQADDFIQSFPEKYDTYIEQGGSNVSGGQKQRLCIARALLRNPKIIIFDDSTSAVDTRTDASIRNSLRKDIPNTTKIIIAQRVASVQDADQIVIMDNGRINAVGTHDDLLKSNEIYQEVYYSQTKEGDK